MATPPTSAIDLAGAGSRVLPRAARGGARPGPQRPRPGALPDRPRRRGHGLRRARRPRPWRTRSTALGERRPRLLLGPDVDPAEALAGQALICTSPSVSSRFPTTEPRLRAALAAVEAEGRVPVVSEVDLFLRLCPAATVGVTGTKGKTTTSSLAAAVLAAGDAPGRAGRQHRHPAHRARGRADAGASRGAGALRAAAADAVARHRHRRLHPRHLRPPRPPRLAGGLPRGEAPAGRAAAGRWRAGAQRRRPGGGGLRGPRTVRAPCPTRRRRPAASCGRRAPMAGSWPATACAPAGTRRPHPAARGDPAARRAQRLQRPRRDGGGPALRRRARRHRRRRARLRRASSIGSSGSPRSPA